MDFLRKNGDWASARGQLWEYPYQPEGDESLRPHAGDSNAFPDMRTGASHIASPEMPGGFGFAGPPMRVLAAGYFGEVAPLRVMVK
jgi:hypothetical protein